MQVKISHVEKTFAKGKNDTLHVLNDIDMTINEGDFVSLLGPSGCGKSTILNLIAGLDSPTSGNVFVNGKQVNKPGNDRVVVFQEAGLFPWMNVLENVAYGLKLKGFSNQESAEKAREGLKMVHLGNFSTAYPHELSGGMKQRVAIARALVMDPDILLMDEPFAALDEQTRMVLHKELLEIWAETGKTILFITHNIREAVMLSNRIVLMGTRPGRIKKEFIVQAALPRDPADSYLVDLERRIMKELEDEMEKVLKEEFGDGYSYKTDRIRRGDHSYMGDHI
ncbi:ABC transporter ATP-binding protein [Shouchella clausii]|uniref:ABC transporter ATP-binding protein n=1 Tax=Shouchella clausii TaxID=79880 RepID=UPI000BA74AD3|nr:ABC transporter ATP-binding protein [Shouchella clausii]PAD41620.1 nitrate/sulfonate/bicarbonate ABC transporter ATP-binding protein [Bacillus sp. 7520-S]MCY1103941.1 ABC transporter ATP-binding protein [Shouchella clausii]MEB5481433.1 ABC transporter ATP-binding protein [Shouchella clausii]PAD09381.1 nitrate/sulfonate/bicarbonate ABC transporter ATP-binding protein [Shouchella clausii]PAD13940.1 nitrate/sulfonate/bicarbonate ABC transporter ATP-binding protein [Shouchella clausii]